MTSETCSVQVKEWYLKYEVLKLKWQLKHAVLKWNGDI